MGENKVDSPSKDKVLKKTVAKCPELTINIEGTPINCLIDTGSEVTTVSESFFRNLLLARPQLHDITKWMRVTGANNLDIPYIGLIEVQLDVFGKTLPDVGVLVVKDPIDPQDKIRKEKIPGILGSNVFGMLTQVCEKRLCRRLWG